MSLTSLLEAVARDRTSFTVYAADPAVATDLETQFAARNVGVTHRPLPSGESEAFVVVRRGGEFRGAVGVEALREFLTPPIRRPWEGAAAAGSERRLFDLLGDLAFVSLNRRQLLATSREIEERVWRVDSGDLHVSFQSMSVLETQESIYERFAEERDVELHLYAVPDESAGESPLAAYPSVTIHADPGEIERFWVLAFDGGDQPDQACGLVAAEGEADTYHGYWTYDRDEVGRIIDALEATVDGED